ncbi:MAG: proprotein convertase P-domain-containing protein [Salibacteraceae bacterium]
MILNQSYYSQGNTVISDGQPSTVYSRINVGATDARLRNIDVLVDLQHSYVRDLELTLIHPNGKRVLLVKKRGGEGDNFDNTIFDDQGPQSISTGQAPFSGRYQPEESFNELLTELVKGMWSLEIKDTAAQDGGSLTRWALFLQVDVPEVKFDKDRFDTRKKVLEALKEANKVLKMVRCVNGKPNGWNDLQNIIDCSGLVVKPKITPPQPFPFEWLDTLSEVGKYTVMNEHLMAIERAIETNHAEVLQLQREIAENFSRD